VGVIRVAGGMLFFKNRDLAADHTARRRTVWESTPDIQALRGLNLKTGEVAGVAIGVNRHRVCVANTHVASTPDVTYDVLCERLVREVQEAEDVARIVQRSVADQRVQGGRILIASPTWAFLVEVLGKQFQMKDLDGDFVMTNHFSLLRHEAKVPTIRAQSSATRLAVAGRMMKSMSGVSQLQSMLRSHVPEKGELSICNHRQDGGGTESSHIIQTDGEQVRWWSLAGFPCEQDYGAVDLSLA
jgi:hypothetical protein